MQEDPTRFARLQEVFGAALERDPEERPAFLAQICDDEPLRRRVEALLAADEETADLLAQPVAGLALRLLGDRPSAIGQHIGPHRLVSEIGHGGMGTIYRAIRDDGEYQDEVAIKLIRRGMDSDAIVQRFRQERQILANLAHPNIARMLDGGVTEDGLPYFVMEHINGLPIDHYCDVHRLPTAARIPLFVTVCDAVQAAHRRLVVHCDLKPSNILVTTDGVPKLLDFGIARLVDPESEREDTATSSRLMTPEYASPEQIRGQPLTTASDVYSLGVVLYQLLTGRRPYRLVTRSYEEIERAILEQKPEQPSSAIHRTMAPGEALPSTPATPEQLSQLRTSTPEELRRRLTGDLDSILLRALAKAPEDRYGSVEQLAEDLRRHLERRPVLARPSTLGYRASRFLRRHRLAVAAAGLVLASLVAGILATAHQARVAQQRELTAEQALSFLIDLFEGSDPDEIGFGDVTLRDVLRRGSEGIEKALHDQPLAQARLMDTIGEVHRKLGDHVEAGKWLTQALARRREHLGDEHADVARTLHRLGTLRYNESHYREAEELLREALAIRIRRFGPAHVEVASSLNNLALVTRRLGQPEAAEALHRRALALRHELLGEEHLEVAVSLMNLAAVLQDDKDYAEAERLTRQALILRRRLVGDQHRLVARSLIRLGSLLARQGEHEEAEASLREALALQRQLLGDLHPDVATTLSNLGSALHRQGDLVAAEQHYLEALDLQHQLLDDQHPDIAKTQRNLAMVLHRQGRRQEALALLREASTALRQRLGPDHPLVARIEKDLARVSSAADRR